MDENIVSDKKWCVYMHTSPSGKRYIGITSQKPNDRWKNGKGYKSCSYFNNAINKYGWNNFEHEIIASNLTEQEAKNFEILLIDKLHTTDENYGYNLSSGGYGPSGVRRSEESKQRMSDAKSLEHVLQFDTDMNFIKEFPNANKAANILNIHQSQILGCCHKLTGYKTAGGYIWIFKRDIDLIDKDEYIKRINHEKLPKPVCQFSLDMKFINEYESIGEAGRICGIGYPDISNVISGRYQQADGFIWILSSDYKKMLSGEIPMRKPYKSTICKPVIQYSYDMEFINEYPSRVEAGKSVGVTPQAIGYACKSESGKSSGFIWRFKEES